MLQGYNCTIFAYGQTGTGKTYTMSGDMSDTLGLLSDSAGIIPRVLHSLFGKLEADEAESSVKCSFIELYNEELRDLLSSDDTTKLKIYEDGQKKGHSATLVHGMEESHIKSAGDGVKLLQNGSHKRQVAATKCNDLSSRSHTVFTVTAYIKRTTDTGEDFISAGKLNLVDLAGSENIQRSGAENKRAAEAGLINKSLLTLGRVINALVERGSHIPYRLVRICIHSLVAEELMHYQGIQTHSTLARFSWWPDQNLYYCHSIACKKQSRRNNLNLRLRIPCKEYSE
jgi:kinesin family protein 11